ncbi:hypothetical protein Nepgr_000021 [Nepenthes gracilis]|uniref:Glutaredoxin domain-containing protein n=1 Tax=Nepenthes gracilis TaxID=150966 RepID=A0AAD3P382_NEPGR|nr:hypothetical protein Nepgr_000021 [Nepenthes gracilis]
MRPSWIKSSRRLHSHPNFQCFSFKDVPNLCIDDSSRDQNPDRQQSTTAKRSSVFHRVRTAASILRQWPGRSGISSPKHPPSPPLSESPAKQSDLSIQPVRFEPSISIFPGYETGIVVYYTSLRVVRPTFEACRAVRSILSGFRVTIDERDVSMDSRFMEELQTILGVTEKLTLPRVFIGGRYVGGAEELKHLHEIGELKKLVEGLPLEDPGMCETCGGYRFILCGECRGSHKIYAEKVGFRSCGACNPNGLIRCPCSCPAPL